MMSDKKRILIFADWFEPGFRAGGPIRSIVNIVHQLKDELEFFIITSDRDHNGKTPYPGINTNTFLQKDGYRVLYAAPGFLSLRRVNAYIKSIHPQKVYLNSMFSVRFSIFPLIASMNVKNKMNIILAPRGMLKPSALQFKIRKKKFFLRVLKFLNLHKNITFQATSAEELHDIRNVFGIDSKIILLQNLPAAISNAMVENLEKSIGTLRMIFVARLHPVKNLDYILKILANCQYDIKLTIVGQKENERYWHSCEKLIDVLPDNISVTVVGDIPHADINRLLSGHHLFVLPTQGENFGYAIYESFCCGRPVLISDQTQWRNLEDKKAGWDINLSEPSKFKEAIDRVALMDKKQWEEWVSGSFNCAKAFSEKSDLRSRYLAFFSERKIIQYTS
jgi:glycosyltransferase involved in cell wall biosynthesis